MNDEELNSVFDNIEGDDPAKVASQDITTYLKSHLKNKVADLESADVPDSTSVPADIEIKKYEVNGEIARGGMGLIMNARDLNIKRTVAMKVLHESKRKSQDNIIRFIEEGQITGQLEHPSIVPVYDLGINDDGNVFYTMKFVKGVTLKEVLRGIAHQHQAVIDEFPLVRLLTIFQKVCDAVAFAHSKGVIHRDLKPENIMIGDYGAVVVMDWGLAKLKIEALNSGLETIRTEVPNFEENELANKQSVDEFSESPADAGLPSMDNDLASMVIDEDSESVRTIDGQILGTPHYMAPEQATGQLDKIDNRTDIYALGGILYGILTLRVPVTGKSFTEMMVNIVRGNIIPPFELNQSPSKIREKSFGRDTQVAGKNAMSTNTTSGTGRSLDDGATGTGRRKMLSIFSHCPGGKIPESVSAVAMKALAREPEHRYPDVEALQKDVEAYQGGFATSAEDAGLIKQIVLLIKRNKTETTILSISALALLIVISFSIQKLKESNLKLSDKSAQLENQNVKLEQQQIKLQKTISQLVDEKRQTEMEREQKEIERVAKEQERTEKVKERKLKEQERLLKVEEKILRKKEEHKREEVSKLSAPEFFTKARRMSEIFRWDEAAEAVDTAISLDTALTEAWYLKGRLHLGNLEFIDALSAFGKSRDIDYQGLETLTKKYRDLLQSGDGRLPSVKLIALSTELRERNDIILSQQIYRMVLNEEVKIMGKLDNAVQELEKRNPGAAPLRYSYDVDEDIILLDLSNNPQLTSIAPLTAAPLTNLNLSFTQVQDFRPLGGLSIKVLHLSSASIGKLKGIHNLPLHDLHIYGVPDANALSPWKDTKIAFHFHFSEADYTGNSKLDFLRTLPPDSYHLYFHGEEFENLKILEDIPVTRLTVAGTGVYDLSPLRYNSLVYLDIRNTRVRNLRTIRDMHLKYLAIDGSAVRDIRVIAGHPLEFLSLKDTKVRSIDALAGLPISHLNLSNTKIDEFNVLRGLPLTELFIANLSVIDLSFIEGMKLMKLDIAGTFVSDIRVLEDMPLKHLNISGTRVVDLRPVKQKPLTYLALNGTPTADIKAIRDMPLKFLDIGNTEIETISVLADMSLRTLIVAKTTISDLSPLANMPLKNLSLLDCDQIKDLKPLLDCRFLTKLIVPKNLANIRILSKAKNLKFLADNGSLADLKQTAAEFWKD